MSLSSGSREKLEMESEGEHGVGLGRQDRNETPKSRRHVCFFWDVENVRVPDKLNAKAIAMKLRNTFVKDGFCEYDFYAACDCTREKKGLLDALNDAEISVLHTNGFKKNSADSKLRSKMRSTASKMREGDKIVLITSDNDFAPEVREIRYTHLLTMILIHNPLVSSALLNFAHEHHSFMDIVKDIAHHTAAKSATEMADNSANKTLILKNLPSRDECMNFNQLEIDVRKLGGRLTFDGHGGKRRAIIHFSTSDACWRAKTRFENYFINGRQVHAGFDRFSQHPESSHDAPPRDHADLRRFRKKPKHTQSPLADAVKVSRGKRERYFRDKALSNLPVVEPITASVAAIQKNYVAAVPRDQLAVPQRRALRYIPLYMQPAGESIDNDSATQNGLQTKNFEFGRGSFGEAQIFANASRFDPPRESHTGAAKKRQLPSPHKSFDAEVDSDIEVLSVKTKRLRVGNSTAADDIIIVEPFPITKKKFRKPIRPLVGELNRGHASTSAQAVHNAVDNFGLDGARAATGLLCLADSNSSMPPTTDSRKFARRLVSGFPE